MEISEGHECVFTFEFENIHICVIHVVHSKVSGVGLWRGVLLRDVSGNSTRFAFNKARVVYV